jgi:hypothetical protein
MHPEIIVEFKENMTSTAGDIDYKYDLLFFEKKINRPQDPTQILSDEGSYSDFIAVLKSRGCSFYDATKKKHWLFFG